MTSYKKTMREAREEMLQSLNESNLEKMRKAAGGAKQTLKMKDGSIGVDSFTASAIMKIYDQINDRNKKTFENMMKNGKKTDIMKLQKFAMSAVRAVAPAEYSEEFEEEFELDEGTKQVLAHGGKGQYKAVIDGDITKIMHKGKVVGTADFDRGADSFFVSIKGEKGQKSFDDAQAMVNYFAKNKITEEVELDEDIMPLIFGGGIIAALLPVLFMSVREIIRGTPLESSIKKIVDKLKKNKNYKMSDSEKSDVKGFVSKVKKEKPSLLQKAMKKIKEEVELDENLQKAKKLMGPSKNREQGIEFVMKGLKISKQKATQMVDKILDEEVELEEGKMSQLHQYIKDKKSAEEIAKIMKLDVKTIKALMNSYESIEGDDMSNNGKYMEMLAAACGPMPGLESVQKEGAATDDCHMSEARRDIDPADVDTSATDDDIKSADKNIMMQMRKAVSLRGQYPVEFLDKKKVKIPQKMAQAVIDKYNKQKKPMDKEKFQAKIAKSYKALLTTMKEQKEETLLDKMNRKILENKNG